MSIFLRPSSPPQSSFFPLLDSLGIPHHEKSQIQSQVSKESGITNKESVRSADTFAALLSARSALIRLVQMVDFTAKGQTHTLPVTRREIFGSLRGNISTADSSCDSNLIASVSNYDSIPNEKKQVLALAGLKKRQLLQTLEILKNGKNLVDERSKIAEKYCQNLKEFNRFWVVQKVWNYPGNYSLRCVYSDAPAWVEEKVLLSTGKTELTMPWSGKFATSIQEEFPEFGNLPNETDQKLFDGEDIGNGEWQRACFALMDAQKARQHILAPLSSHPLLHNLLNCHAMEKAEITDEAIKHVNLIKQLQTLLSAKKLPYFFHFISLSESFLFLYEGREILLRVQIKGEKMILLSKNVADKKAIWSSIPLQLAVVLQMKDLENMIDDMLGTMTD